MFDSAKFICVKDLSKELVDVDLVVSVGGDGTFIRVSHLLDEQFIVGVNSEPEFSEGALCSVDCYGLQKLKGILEGQYGIRRRNRIQISINGEVVEEKALNEIYFGSRNQFHTSRYLLKLGEKEEEQRSSGALVTTCTGSDAWYKSAGGKPFVGDELRYLIREPFVSRVFDSKFLGGVIGEEMKFTSKMHHEAVIAIDSNKEYAVNFDDEVVVCSSSIFLNVLEVKV